MMMRFEKVDSNIVNGVAYDECDFGLSTKRIIS